MKKNNFLKMLMSVVLIIAVAIFVSACSGDNNDYEDLSQAQDNNFIADLDHLLLMLEQHFPYFNAIYEHRGININALHASAVQDVLNSQDLDLYGFAAIVLRNFAPLNGIGAFHMQPPLLGDITDEMVAMAEQLGLDVNNPDEQVFLSLVASVPQRLMMLRELVYMEAGGEAADLFTELVQNKDFEAFLRFEEMMTAAPREMVTTNTIESASVAHLAIHELNSGISRYVLDFYREISDFEHLVIDLRGAQGIDVSAFFELVIVPNISQPLVTTGYAFFMDDLSSVRERESWRNDFLNSWGNRFRADAPVGEGVVAFGDKAGMNYGFAFETYAYPRFSWQEPIFGGKIWLLIDENASSAVEVIARFVKETGFATIVGNATSGNFGSSRRHMATPNSFLIFMYDTLYVVDGSGRPMIAGTEPHYFNHAGMDAFETVLAMIGEM
ncbi:MAG: S41 family peptidase [Defluviitaleaceae bacterium]|nr:S41 family peptidase [Defluviitaleaceae bacterium]